MESTPAERNSAFFRFEELRIYHKALDYINWVHQATASFDPKTNDNIADSFNKTARSIAMNIAEGSARNKSQFIYYLKMAKSAVREALVLTSACHNMGYIDDDKNTESRGYLMEMTKMIGALISSLQRSQDSSRESDDDHEDDMLDEPKKYDSHNY